MDWNVQLKTTGFNDWIAFMEQKLTRVKDLLEILEAEEEQLKNTWDSASMRQWEKEFKTFMGQVREAAEEMKKLILAVSEIASVLAEMEKGMASAAERT